MSWLDLPRVPEPEVMDDSAEVEAYASAAAQAYLERVDDTFVEHALRLVAGCPAGAALDVGTGPGQIVRKLAQRLPGWSFVGVDRSPSMIAQARASLAPSPQATASFARVQFFVGDGNDLPFPDAGFDLVLCNSVLHHLAEPQRILNEIARLRKPRGAILLRDLRRPSRWAFPLHVRWHGRHYSGLMYQLYCASVRAAYTLPEMEEMLRRMPLGAAGSAARARVFAHQRTHLGIERSVG